MHALKVLTLDHPEIRARLMAEGKARTRLNHPNLVVVRDVLHLEDTPALLMDFVPGELIDAIHRSVPHPDEAFLFNQVVKGRRLCHENGMIHRDLKPSNVLLDQTCDPPVARVTDFGLVRTIAPARDTPRLTNVGVAMGTLGYMAPEQLRDAHSVDKRTDIFALGALLYALLTGRPPFDGHDQLKIMNDTASGAYVPIGDAFGRGLQAVIARCLAVDPSDRFQDAAALLAALDIGQAPADPDQTFSWVVQRAGALYTRAASDHHPGHGRDQHDGPCAHRGPGGAGHQVTLSVVLDPTSEASNTHRTWGECRRCRSDRGRARAG